MFLQNSFIFRFNSRKKNLKLGYFFNQTILTDFLCRLKKFNASLRLSFKVRVKTFNIG